MSDVRFDPKDPAFADRVRASFDRQDAMKTIGATLTKVEPGVVFIEMPWTQALTQQHGFLHGGIIATALDSACGYAAFSLMPADAAVLTVEYKMNMLAPGKGERFRMEGVVAKPGRTITVVDGKAWAIDGGREKLIGTMSCTLMAVHGREGLHH
ncbi:MAG TPA: PaaI family thioesterase [Ramlibacter sp.]|nr:PaaI family thioesterase [Ramlibacter sp.]